MLASELIAQDLTQLARAFQASLDLSLLESYFKNYLAGNASNLRLLGEGSHFRALKVEASHLAFEYVLSVGHGMGVFASEAEGEGFYRKWYSLMQTLPKEPLIPPFALLRQGDVFAWVLPYGTQGEDQAKSHWQPLPEIFAQLQRSFLLAGILLEDTWQLRYWRGIPFLCDLSGIKALSRKR